MKAKTVQPGDLIDGRAVKHVTKSSSCTTRNQSNGSVGRLPNITVSSKVIEILFEDRGDPLYRWPDRDVEVQRP